MAEWKRVFSSPLIIGLLAFLTGLTVFLTFFQLRQSGYGIHEYREAYQEELQKLQAIPIDRAADALAASQQEAARWNTLYMYAASQNETLRSMLREQCASDFGEDFERQLASGKLNVSPAAVHESNLKQDVWRKLSEQVSYLSSYPDYLNNLHSNAKKMAGMRVFCDADVFGMKNIERTDRDFPTEVEIKLDNDLAVSAFLENRLPAYAAFIFMAALVLCFLEERRRGLWVLIYGTPEGRGCLALHRAGILLLGALLSVILIFGARIATLSIACGGLGDFSRSVQSISVFQGFPDVMSVRSFLLFYVVCSVLGLWLLGLILWAALQAVSSFHLAVLFAGLLLAAEYALFTLIPDSYSIVLLRFLNLFALIDLPRVFLRYLNVDLFGQAVRGSACTLLAMPFAILLSGSACLRIQAKKYPIQKQNPILRLLERAQTKTIGILGHLHLFGLELHKLLWQQRGILVLLAFLIWTAAYKKAPPVDTNLYEPASAVYEIKYQGPVTGETKQALQAELDNALKNTGSAAPAEAVKGLTLLLSRVDQILAGRQKIEFVNPVPYAALMNRNIQNAQRVNGLLSMLFVILILSGLFAYENQSRMHSVLRSSARGKIVWLSKISLAMSAVAVLWLASSLRELWLIEKTYAVFGGLSAPVQSLPMFADAHLHVPVWTAVAGFLLLRLLALEALAMGVCLLSLLCRNQNTAILVNCAVFLLPAALSSIGIDMFDQISLIRLLSPLECGSEEYILCAVGGALFTVGSYLLYAKRS